MAQAAKLSKVPDAQIESNVLQALAADSKLATQAISTASVYGTVTLTGSVLDEPTRALAEQTVARTVGVVRVVDELTLTPAAGSASAVTAPIERGQSGPTSGLPASIDANAGSNPVLQSDGTYAAPDGVQQTGPSTGSVTQPGAGIPAQDYPGVQTPGEPSQGPNPADRPGVPTSGGLPPPPPSGRMPYPGQRYSDYVSHGSREQLGGVPVTVPVSTALEISTNQALSSRETPAGSTFTGTVLYDVLAEGYVAIPRGTQVSGIVREATSSGVLKGRGELSLELTTLQYAGQSYPIATDTWSHAGGDKTLRTVNSAVGLGAVGAIIGGVTGGGAGAAIGAGVGGAAGIGASALSQGGQVVVPPEGVLTFHLTQPAQLTTVSQAELNRLGAGAPAPAGYARRYPYPPPYAYGPGPYAYPGYYAYPYPYYYPRYYRRY